MPGGRFFVSNPTKFIILVLFVISIVSSPVQATLTEMSNEELRSVHGQAQLMTMDMHDGNVNDGAVDNTNLTFARIELNTRLTGLADREGCEPPNCDRSPGTSDLVCTDAGDAGCGLDDGSAFKINQLKVGHYWDGTSHEWDINGSSFELPNDDRGQVIARGPYVSLAFKGIDDGVADNTQVVGVRVGAKKIRGGGTFNLDQLSGAFRGSDFNIPCYLGGCVSTRGHRMDGNAKLFSLFSKLSLGNNGSKFGDDDGWTEDLWLSWQKRAIFWEKQNPAFNWDNQSPAFGTGETEFHRDGKGFWIHATDDIVGGVL